MPLTDKELGMIEECVRAETVVVRKLPAMIQQCTDPQLRQLMSEIHQTHQRHLDQLSGQIR
ncbi:MAG: spore coat protein [Bacillota bacterium]